MLVRPRRSRIRTRISCLTVSAIYTAHVAASRGALTFPGRDLRWALKASLAFSPATALRQNRRISKTAARANGEEQRAEKIVAPSFHPSALLLLARDYVLSRRQANGAARALDNLEASGTHCATRARLLNSPSNHGRISCRDFAAIAFLRPSRFFVSFACFLRAAVLSPFARPTHNYRSAVFS